MSIPASANGTGLRPYLLQHIRNVVGEPATPELKIENNGFLNFLQSQDKPEVLRLSDGKGGLNSAQIKYHQRLIPAYTRTSESCTQSAQMPYAEASVLLNVYREYSLYLPEELMAAYTSDCTEMLTAGTPPTKMMNELLTQICASANAILTALNGDLLTLAVANIGINRSTGNNTAKAINFTQNTNNLPLHDGITELMSDMTVNLVSGEPFIVGNGLWLNYFQQQKSKGIAQNGLNTAVEAGGLKFLYDNSSISLLGANQALAFEANATQIVEYLKFQGFKSGTRGTSDFGVISLPYQATSNLVKMVDFDYQLKYNDCPTVITDEYYGTTTTLDRGYQLILSKTCGLFQIPQGAYSAADPNYGVNGSFRYVATNV